MWVLKMQEDKIITLRIVLVDSDGIPYDLSNASEIKLRLLQKNYVSAVLTGHVQNSQNGEVSFLVDTRYFKPGEVDAEIEYKEDRSQKHFNIKYNIIIEEVKAPFNPSLRICRDE